MASVAQQNIGWIKQFAPRFGIDPWAALAVALYGEGTYKGNTGDAGTSFGPFGLHWGGAMPKRYVGNSKASQAFANSPQGILYALRGMAGSGARGLHGESAIAAIIRNFERPANPQAEIARASAHYGGSLGAGGGGGAAQTGLLGAAPTSDSRGQLAMALLQGLQSGHPASPSSLMSVLQQGQNGGATGGRAPTGPASGGALSFKGSGAWAGSQSIANQLKAGLGLSVTSGKRSKKMTASGGVSDHWTGSKTAFAYDMGGSVGAMDRAAVILAHRLGIAYKAGQPLVVTLNRGGYRIQLLYRTHIGGDHFTHIHIGVKRL